MIADRIERIQRRLPAVVTSRKKSSELLKELRRLTHAKLACEVRRFRVKAGSEKA